MDRRERVAVVCAGLFYALAEFMFGFALVLASVSRGHPPSSWVDIVKAVARSDAGAFQLRWLLTTTRGLQRAGKVLLGLGVMIDGAVKGGLLVGVLRGSRATTVVATLAFGAVAVGGLVVAGANPPIGTFVTALLNVALAVVVALEMRRAVTAHPFVR